MNQLPKLLKDQYSSYSTFTYPGLYEKNLRNDLPDRIEDVGLLVRKNFIHRTTLAAGNTLNNTDLRFGDMTKVPWWRQPEDDVLQTVAAMIAELYRRDSNGLNLSRAVEDKLVLTCRYVAILMASILKAKRIPARVRAGHAPYFNMGKLGDVSTDHWITQYWSDEQSRWVTIDVDGSLSIEDEKINPYDLQEGQFDFPADAWLVVRAGEVSENYFYNAGGYKGLIVLAWALASDFHCLMNNEIIYNHGFSFVNRDIFKSQDNEKLTVLDKLAELMKSPDENFEKLQYLYETNRDYRLLAGSLL